MEKEKILTLAALFLFIIAFVHTSYHLATYGSGINGLYKNGISGFSIKNQTDEGSTGSQHGQFSFSIIGLEWLILITTLLFSVTRQHLGLNQETFSLDISSRYINSKTKTDLDVLYDLVKERGRIKLSTAARLFKTEKEKIIEWCSILEGANLVQMDYPKVGEPEIIKVK